jgi:hypothetical protein
VSPHSAAENFASLALTFASQAQKTTFVSLSLSMHGLQPRAQPHSCADSFQSHRHNACTAADRLSSVATLDPRSSQSNRNDPCRRCADQLVHRGVPTL